ncbi:DUF3102 domain-containing protein, partial [Martelella sp. FLE1502]
PSRVTIETKPPANPERFRMDFSSNLNSDIPELELASEVNEPAVKQVEEAKGATEIVQSDRLVSKPGFDYLALPKAIAEEAESTAERIRQRHRDSIIATGNDLLKIKDKLRHGLFGKWLKFHFDMSERTAQNYMNVAIEFGAVPQVIDHMPPATLYKLAAKSTPLKLRKSVIAEIANGGIPQPQDVAERIAEAKRKERHVNAIKKAKQAKARAWGKHEGQLKMIGMSSEAIEVEKMNWNAEWEEKHGARSAGNQDTQKTIGAGSQQSQQQKAEAFVSILKRKMGPGFAGFRELMLQIEPSELQKAFKKA